MKILITSGGTSEDIDRVRHITNLSTGLLGKEMAETFLTAGFDVSLVTTAQAVKPADHPNLSITLIKNVADLQTALEPMVKTHEVLIHAMAVSDYTPVVMTDFETVSQSKDIREFLTQVNTESKISSTADYQVLFLKKTPKIISQVKNWNANILLIGFKLLVAVSQEELLSVARQSLVKNRADYIVANDLTTIQAGQHIAHIVSPKEVVTVDSKAAIAQELLTIVRKRDPQ